MMHPTYDFPGGNAVILEVQPDANPPEIHFAPSPGDGPEAIWFYFAIDPGDTATPRIRCLLHFIENLLGNSTGAGTAGLHPVYRTERQDWTRIESVERIEMPDGRILAGWTVPGDAGRVDVALSYPYGTSQRDELCRDLHGVFDAAPIGLTSAGHAISRLYNRAGAADDDTPGIYCLARQHAAEAPGSWVLDGFLRRMADGGDRAPLVWAVPFADVDGVCSGSAGKDRFPWDFNRAWGSKRFPTELKLEMGTHPMRHEIKALQNDMLRWQTRCRPVLVLDFHAPTICNHSGIYVYVRDLDAEGRPDAAHAPWVDAFRQRIDARLRADRFARSGRYPGRWNTARVGDFVNRALGLPEITFETPYGAAGREMFTRETYRAAGSQIAEAVLTNLANQ